MEADSSSSSLINEEKEAQGLVDVLADTLDNVEVTEAVGDDSKQGDHAKRKSKKKKKKKPLKHEVVHLNFPVENYFPWKIAKLKNRGRSAVSTKAIKAGEIIVAEHAVAFVPREQYRNAICHICGRDRSIHEPKRDCSTCEYTVFCEDCAKPPQESHRRHCTVHKNIGSVARDENCDADLLRLVYNLAVRKTETKSSEDCSTETYCKDGIIYSSFQDAMSLETHRDKAPQDWLAAVHNGCSRLHKIACVEADDGEPAPLSCTIEELEVLATLVNTNAHGMGAQGIHNTDVALGIFPFVSILNHSCRPNCCFASSGSLMYVRAVQDIPTGTELCLSYINLYEARNVRKAQLAATKHFDCTCERCIEPLKTSIDRLLEGCVCHVRGCGGVLIRSSSLHDDQPESETWECDLCSRVLNPNGASKLNVNDKPWEMISTAEKKLVAAVRVYSEKRYKEAKKLLEDYLSECTGKLHQLHVLSFDALTPLMNCCRALEETEEGLRVCRLIIQSMEKVLPGPSLELGNFYYCLGEMYVEKAHAFSGSVIARRSAKQAQEAFERVKNMREICLGRPTLPA